jgi:hypothetical protein
MDGVTRLNKSHLAACGWRKKLSGVFSMTIFVVQVGYCSAYLDAYTVQKETAKSYIIKHSYLRSIRKEADGRLIFPDAFSAYACLTAHRKQIKERAEAAYEEAKRLMLEAA